jgi:hypothetical protein
MIFHWNIAIEIYNLSINRSCWFSCNIVRTQMLFSSIRCLWMLYNDGVQGVLQQFHPVYKAHRILFPAMAADHLQKSYYACRRKLCGDFRVDKSSIADYCRRNIFIMQIVNHSAQIITSLFPWSKSRQSF